MAFVSRFTVIVVKSFILIKLIKLIKLIYKAFASGSFQNVCLYDLAFFSLKKLKSLFKFLGFSKKGQDLTFFSFDVNFTVYSRDKEYISLLYSKESRRYEMKKRLLPEIQEGIRVEFASPQNGATYCGVVAKRTGNTLTVRRTLNQKQRIHVKLLTGYWPPRVKASPGNKVQIKG